MDKHKKFMAWAKEKGVTMNGISAHRWEGRGVGIRADRDINVGEIILEIPASALRHAKTVPQAIKRRLGEITIHGLLATDLVLDTTPARQPWRDVLPTKTDFHESHPMTWDPSLQLLLPSAAQSLLQNQQKKFRLDWSTVSKAYPEISKEDYHYAWLIVNTRTFYWLFPNAKKKLIADDCMALCPFADYFNHTSVGCNVDFDGSGFTIQADRAYPKHSEIYISYGSHTNDFLLAEYGFVMAENSWDYVSLDKPILDSLDDNQKEKLKDEGFLGGYVLNGDGVCYRTQVSMCVGVLSGRKWKRFIDGQESSEKDQAVVDEALRGLIQGYVTEAEKIRQKVRDDKAGLPCQRKTLEQRWTQIICLLQGEILRLR